MYRTSPPAYAPQARLKSDLISFAGREPDFDQAAGGESFDDLVFADRLHTLRIARVGLLLNQRLLIPHEVVAPDPDSGSGCP